MQIPTGTPSLNLLQFLDDKQLVEVNSQIIDLYQKELTNKNVAEYKKKQDNRFA